MARSIQQVKEFVELAQRTDATECRVVVIQRGAQKGQSKLKLRTGSTLFTLSVKDTTRVKAILKAIRPHVKIVKV